MSIFPDRVLWLTGAMCWFAMAVLFVGVAWLSARDAWRKATRQRRWNRNVRAAQARARARHGEP